jgi:hypothetical protein
MKSKIIHFFSLALVLMVFGSCHKDNIISNDKQVGISRITYFADLTLLGNQYMSVVKGQAFTDPGATATQSGKPLTVTVGGSVNTTAVGIYVLTYSAVNSDGFPASVTRTVAVIPAAETPGVDLTGTYYYIAVPATTSSITKLAPGFYSTTNCWSAATTIACLFICVDGINITMPAQPTPYGTLNGTGTLIAGALTYSVSIPSQGLNNVARKWHVQ